MVHWRALLGRFLLPLALLAATAGAGSACENDSRSEPAERQMQQDYRPPEAVPADSAGSGFALAGMGVGAALLLGSLGWSVWRNMTAVP